jgi:hypothetical protein
MASISRRTAMLAIGSTSAAALVDVKAAEAAAWDSALTEYQQAKAACEAFSPTWDRAYHAWSTSRPSMDGIHWREFSFRDRLHLARIMDLDKEWARYLDGEGKWWFAPDPEPCKARYRAVLDSVAEFRKAESDHSATTGMTAADEHNERLSEAFSQAEEALVTTPAPHTAALLWKLEHLFGADARCPEEEAPCWCARWTEAFLSDARRLLSNGRG